MAFKAVIKNYHKEYIVTLLAEYRPPKEIIALVKKKYDIVIWPTQVYKVRDQRREIINKLRVAYLKDITEIPIAQKKVRLERVEEQYVAANQITNTERRINAKLKCLDHAQQEIEGKTRMGDTFLNFQQNNIFTEYTNEQLIKKRKEILTKMKKARVPDVIEAKGN